MLKKRNGQSVVEYAVMVAVVIAALIALNIFIKRGFMGRYRSYGDQAGTQFSFAAGTTNISETVNSVRGERTYENGMSTTNYVTDRQNRTEIMNLRNVGNENLFY